MNKMGGLQQCQYQVVILYYSFAKYCYLGETGLRVHGISLNYSLELHVSQIISIKLSIKNGRSQLMIEMEFSGEDSFWVCIVLRKSCMNSEDLEVGTSRTELCLRRSDYILDPS